MLSLLTVLNNSVSVMSNMMTFYQPGLPNWLKQVVLSH